MYFPTWISMPTVILQNFITNKRYRQYTTASIRDLVSVDEVLELIASFRWDIY